MWFSRFAALALCVACAPVPPTDLPPGTRVDVTPGLVEIEPDLCRLGDFQQYVGQPGAVLDGVTIARVHRVIPYGGIVTQEYAAGRVNFWLNPAGNIERIGCG